MFTYTPLQHDLYNFYSLNRATIKSLEVIPEPKFEIGSNILTAICDRGISGKYLVANLFRNKKGYIDYKEIGQNGDIEIIERYHQPGDYVIAGVIKSTNPKNTQLSLK